MSTGDGLPRFGVMEFDLADLSNLISSGTLTAVITHEMGHLLGIGTRWTSAKPGVVLTGGGPGEHGDQPAVASPPVMPSPQSLTAPAGN